MLQETTVKIRDFLTDFLSSAAAALLAALLFLVAPPAAAGQWMPTDTGFVRGETPNLLPDTVRRATSIALFSLPGSSTAERLATLPLSSSTPIPPLITEEEDLRKRLLPYALVGAIVGGVIGYAAHEEVFWKRDKESCNLGDISVCAFTPYAYVFVGATVGTWTGIVIGYLRERR